MMAHAVSDLVNNARFFPISFVDELETILLFVRRNLVFSSPASHQLLFGFIYEVPNFFTLAILIR